MDMRGAKILVESLKRVGVEVIFGITGGAIMPVCDDLLDEPSIKFIHTRHEQGATHAADGYARATGRVGVALATSGPGATNLTTGIANAYMDSIPIVTITGQVHTHLMGNDAFQEADVMGITRPICKHSYLIKSADETARMVKEAFYVASTGRPGPVIIDFAKDAQFAESAFEYPEGVNMRGYNPRYDGHPLQIAKAVDAISAAKQPIVYAGGGIITSGASEELYEFVTKTNIPITVTLTGLGAFPETHPLAMKMPGMHGSRCANYAFTETDLIIAVGTRFDDRVTGKLDEFAPNAKVIHIDIDPSCISKNVHADIPIVGDAKQILAEMNKLVHKVDIEPWLKQISIWKQKYPFRYRMKEDKIMPQFVIEQTSEVTKGEAVIVTDVGQHQMWAAQFYQHTKPRHFLSSGGLGTMGYGMPASIGAQIGCPDKLVININGDGSFMMNVQELATIARYNLPIKVFIINNGYLGMVRQWQELFFDKRYAVTSLHDNPDFAKLAGVFGIKGMKVTKPEEVRPAIEKALDIDAPVVVDFTVDPEANVFPMVPSGAPLYEMQEEHHDESFIPSWLPASGFAPQTRVEPDKQHIISVLVENRMGVLARIASLFSGRAFNIDSLTVAETDDQTVSRMTITSTGDKKIIEQITKQLNKLVDVIKVADVTGEQFVDRELVLIKVNADAQVRSEIIQVVDIFRARIVDVTPTTVMIETTGDEEKLTAIIDMLRPYGIREIARTGKIAMLRGAAK